MRFELSKTPPPHQNRRLQLRMLGFVAMIGVIMFIMTAFQPKADKPKSGRPVQTPEAPVYDVQPEGRSLKPGEFVTPQDNEPWQEPPPIAEMPDDGELDKKLTKLETQFDKRVLRRVKDNTLGIRRDEADAYYRLLDHARHVPDSQLDKIGATDVLYINLMTQPDQFRGEPVTIHGDLWRLYEIQAGENPYRFKTLYEAWIFTGDSGTHPYRVVFSSLPKELEPGENLRKPVRVTGYFFKREGYASTGGMHVAPTLLAHRVTTFRPPDAAPPTDAILPYMIVLVAAVGLAFLVTLVSFAISDRRAARAAMLRELNGPRPSFDGIDAGPILSVQQQLQQIEEREWQAKADATDPEYHDVSAALHARDKVATSPPKPPVVEPDPQQAAREHRQGVNAIQAWTSRQTDASDKPVAAPDPEPSEPSNATASQPDPIDPPQGNGLSKLAAWENEIQQFASRATPQTEEQRRAQREVDRDRATRSQELDERLLQERSDLNRQSSDETDEEIPDDEDESLSNESTRRVIDRADRDSDEVDEDAESGDWDQGHAARRRRRRDR